MTKILLSDVFCVSYICKKQSAVKLVYNDHPWDPKIVAVVVRWSLFRGNFCYKTAKWDLKIVVFIDRWSLTQV